MKIPSVAKQSLSNCEMSILRRVTFKGIWMEAMKAGEPPVGADSSDDPGEIISVLLHAAVYVRQRLGEFLLRFDLSEGRYAILMELDQVGAAGLSQADLAERLLQSESNVSSLIDRLHRDALVDRRWSDTDRRKRVLLLTAQGGDLIQKVEAAHQRWAEMMLGDLSSQDRKALYQSLKRLPSNVSSPPLAHAKVGVPKGPHVPEELWSNHTVIIGRDPNSPRVALEKMLSALGLVGRFAEDAE
jgi:DNA-binding MarR family transcriptional regulator